MRWRRCVLTRYSSGLFTTRGGSLSRLFTTRGRSSRCFVPCSGSTSSVSLTGRCGWTSCLLSESARQTHTDRVVPCRCRGSGRSHTDGVVPWYGCGGCSHTDARWRSTLSRGWGRRRCGQGTRIVDSLCLRPGRRLVHAQTVNVPIIQPFMVRVDRHVQIVACVDRQVQVVEHVTRHTPLL